MPNVKEVWGLRGWSQGEDSLTSGTVTVQISNESFELKRIGSSEVPKWEDIKHKHDGKDRLGYNPATETREIVEEDFSAVKAYLDGKSDGDNSVQLKKRGGDRSMLAKL